MMLFAFRKVRAQVCLRKRSDVMVLRKRKANDVSRCFSILLLDESKQDRRKITNTLKKLLAGSQISRSSLDIEVAHVDTKTGKLAQRRSELLCRWLVRMLSSQIGLCSSPDMNGQFTKRERDVLEDTICPLIELSAPKSIVVNKRLASMTSPSHQRFSTSAPDIL